MTERPSDSTNISAYDALYEAQKIAFAPIIFQVARTLRDLGIFDELEKSGKKGKTAGEISESLGISRYGVETLLESGLTANMVACDAASDSNYHDRVYRITKVGYFLLNDQMTRVNLDFNHFVCYEGMMALDRAIVDGKPRGLKALGGQWTTLYEALPHLPEQIKSSWDRFDHFYSSGTYPQVLPIVLRGQPETLIDIGANSGEFAILAAQYDPRIRITMVDLEAQLELALGNIAHEGLADQVSGLSMNLLDRTAAFPTGADIYWMSQFLSCFSPDEIVSILDRVCHAMTKDSRVLIMETCWDRQRHDASAFSLINTSPYFTCIANGNSKMYHSSELMDCINVAGLEVSQIHDSLGICHTLFECTQP